MVQTNNPDISDRQTRGWIYSDVFSNKKISFTGSNSGHFCHI